MRASDAEFYPVPEGYDILGGTENADLRAIEARAAESLTAEGRQSHRIDVALRKIGPVAAATRHFRGPGGAPIADPEAAPGPNAEFRQEQA